MTTSEHTTAARRVGDAIPIPGNYQFRAAHDGRAPQRFWHQRRFAACLDMLELDGDMRVLDAGCGSGVFADLVAQHPGARVTAVDGNPAAIAFAREKYPRSNLEFRQGLVDELDFVPSSFDRISCLEVIEHIHLDQAKHMLATFHRLLRPGGRLVISTPNVRSYWPALEWTLDQLRLVPQMEGEQHVAGYHPESLRALGTGCGFRHLRTRTLFVVSPWLAVASWRLAQTAHDWEQRTGTGLGALLVQSFEAPAGKA